ncbi:phosphatidylserine decarboxylase family protein [Fulvivirga sediminis]|uniref:Phosphatidylserine decarboxylase proenzyme n=1 Tax=Fulvivirga sediminis TaxID=2803949 RepID=A0A937F323_9BACT|nr:phosphatidylserine decarboxylase family protein [Fulvivirga sediminis]MBL3654815.1 phosphatidylserine decarboxylase family protein [Fulvivirga sediminis]
MTIHKEGRVLLAVMLIVLVIINVVVLYAFPARPIIFNISLAASIVLFLLILQFFRNPKIVSPLDEKHVLAPADGKVVVIEETTETEYLKDRRLQISIFMSPVNVHVNRMPVKGVVEFFKYHAGKYLVAWHPKSSTENERTTLVVKTGQGVPVLVRQIAGALARRIKWYVKEGQQFEQAEEFGFIKFGSRVDVFLPLDAKVKVNIGEKTKGGRTVLAEI